MSRKTLGYSQLIQYGLLAAPVAFAGFPLYVLAPDFYATHQGVSLSVLGLMLLCLRALDAIQDPFIGAISDRFPQAMRPLMLVSAMLLVVSVYALFNPIGLNPIIWFLLSMGLAVIAYSILSINLSALGALWTKEPQEQTKIAGVREACGLLGLLFAVTLPGILSSFSPAEQVYVWFSAILGVMMAASFLAFNKWYKHQPAIARPEPTNQSLWATLLSFPAKTHRLYMVYGLSVLASSIPAVLVIFFIRDRLDAQTHTGVFLLLYFLSGAMAMPFWKKLSTTFGKYSAWMISIFFAVASFVWAFFLGAGDVWQYAIICIASGMALGGDLALPPSILADQIHESATQTSAATQYSVLALLNKAGLAVASAIALPLLDVAGFVPAAINTDSALNHLSMAYALIPCLIKLAAAYLLYVFFIHPDRKKNHETALETNPHRSHLHA